MIFSHKPCGAAGIVRDHAGRVLLVKASYRSYWTLPGGIVERGESPLHGCLREVHEETNLRFSDARLVGLDWRRRAPGNDSLHFVFDCGRVSAEQAAEVKPQRFEISECRWLSLDEALPLMNERHRLRVSKCLEAAERGTTVYLENGQFV